MKNKRDRAIVLARVDEETQEKVKAVAKHLGYVYGGKGSIGKLLDGIAKGEVVLTKRLTASDI